MCTRRAGTPPLESAASATASHNTAGSSALMRPAMASSRSEALMP